MYGTRGGPFITGNVTLYPHSLDPLRTPYLSPVVSTRKGDTIYVHVLKWMGNRLHLPRINRKIISHQVLTGGTAVVEQSGAGITISVPPAHRNELDTIIVLTLDGSAMDLPADTIGAMWQ